LVGSAPETWPIWFALEPLEFFGPPVGPFTRSAPLARDGSILAVETPAHMKGHVSIVARSEALTYLLAGDVTYRPYLPMDDVVNGMTENAAKSLATLRANKQISQAEPTVLLPTHNPDAAKRLADGLTTDP
jgi:glyoxylase-like metal-dependent hydrolase (beta-lactamase superfamily II)